MVNRGKPVHIYFAETDLPYSADLDQSRHSENSDTKMQELGLLGTFKALDELRNQLDRAIEFDVTRFLNSLIDAEDPDRESVRREQAWKQFEQSSDAAAFPPHELSVLRLLADGMPTTQIASTLGVTARDVQLNRKSIMQKLHVKDPTKLAVVLQERFPSWAKN